MLKVGTLDRAAEEEEKLAPKTVLRPAAVAGPVAHPSSPWESLQKKLAKSWRNGPSYRGHTSECMAL